MIAIVGAGPIGIYVSGLLLNQGHTVHLFESGDYKHESRFLNHDSYKFKAKSAMPKNVHRVGGGSNFWHARFGEFLINDFLTLPSLKISGWCLKKSSLKEHYKIVAKELSGKAFSDEEYIKKNFYLQKELLNEKLDLRVFRFADHYSFVSKVIELENNLNFTLHLRTKVENIEHLSNKSKILLTVRNEKSLQKMSFNYVIITSGTLQSTKLILQSPSLLTESNAKFAGIGLMEHLEGFIGLMRVPDASMPKVNMFSLTKNNRLHNLEAGLGIRLNSDIQKEFEIPSCHIEIRPRPRPIRTSKYLFRSPVHNPLYYLERFLRKIYEILAQFYDRLLGRFTFGVWLKSEEFANRGSTLSLDSSKDSLVYDHQVSNLSYDQLYKAINLLIPEVEKNLEVSIDLFRWVQRRSKNVNLEINWHPMGTLPMGVDPTTHICDNNLEVHGKNRVFILSPAIFNRGSNGNPTFTTLALASRMVKENFAKSKRYEA